MKIRNLLAVLLVGLSCNLLADTPYHRIDCNFADPDSQFLVNGRVLNTTSVKAYTWQETNVFNPLGYNAYFSFAKDFNATSMIVVTGVTYSTYIDFPITSNTFARPVKEWYASVMLTKPSDGSVHSIAYGALTIKAAPEVNASGTFFSQRAINGSEYGPFTGSFTNWPFALSGSYGEYILAAEFNASNLVLQTQINTNLAKQTSSNSVFQSQFTVLSTGKTDQATYNANLVSQGNTNAVFQALHNAQVNTNSGFNSRIVSEEAKSVAQVNTNAGFQALHTAQVNTNSSLQGQINSLATSTSEVTIAVYNAHVAAQANTNAGFQVLFGNQTSTNVGFESRIAANTSTGAANAAKIVLTSNAFVAADTVIRDTIGILSNYVVVSDVGLLDKIVIVSNAFRNGDSVVSNAFVAADSALSDRINSISNNYIAADTAQAATNTAFQLQITNNLAAQGNTNTDFNVRITSNETFRITTQPATNVALLSQIVTNVVIQQGTNSFFQGLLDALVGTNSLFQGLFTAQASTNSLFQGLFDALSSTNSLFQGWFTTLNGYTNVAQTAYSWGSHASMNYLTTGTIQSITVADRSALGTNLSGLTQETYTGSLTSVSYTGVTALVQGYTYAWGFTKANAFGTSTLSIATFSLVETTAGATSNHFAFVGTDTNLVLRLDGDGSSKSDVSALYIKQITNGDIDAAGDMNIGGVLRLNGAVSTNPVVHIAQTTNAHGGIVGANDPAYLAALTNATIAGGTSLVVSVTGRILGITTRTNFVENNSGNWAGTWQGLGTNVFVQTNDPAMTNARAPLTHTQDASTITNAPWLTNEPFAIAFSNANQEKITAAITNETGATNIAAGATDSYNYSTRTLTWNTNAVGGGAGGGDFMADGSVPMTGPLQMGAQIITNVAHIDFSGTDVSVGLGATVSGGTEGCVAVGRSANGNDDGTAVGYLAIGNLNGAAVGRAANGSIAGVAVGVQTEGGYFGVAVGTSANGTNYGVAVGSTANGANHGVAIGYQASAVSNSAAIGRGVVNTEPNSTKIIGNLNMGGQAVTNAPNLVYTNTPTYTDAVAKATAALPKAGGTMTGPLTNIFGFYGDGGGLTNLSALTATNSDALGNIAAAVWSGATNALNSAVTNLQGPFQQYSAEIYAGDGGTATITFANGSLLRLVATNATTFTFDSSTYATNGVSRVGLEVLAGANSIAFATATITNATAPTISTSTWSSLFFRRVEDGLWKGRQ